MHEIKQPKKRQQALEVSNYYYFATPKGLVKQEEIPPECGLVEIDKNSNRLSWSVKAPYRETEEPTWSFVTSLLRLAKGEYMEDQLRSKIRGLQWEVDDLKTRLKFWEHYQEEKQRLESELRQARRELAKYKNVI